MKSYENLAVLAALHSIELRVSVSYFMKNRVNDNNMIVSVYQNVCVGIFVSEKIR